MVSSNYQTYVNDLQVIEKMRGLEHKFKYEIEKKLNEAISGICGLILLFIKYLYYIHDITTMSMVYNIYL